MAPRLCKLQVAPRLCKLPRAYEAPRSRRWLCNHPQTLDRLLNEIERRFENDRFCDHAETIYHLLAVSLDVLANEALEGQQNAHG